jgi:cell division protein ZapA (FtsZ GTPase activity inhibitor)
MSGTSQPRPIVNDTLSIKVQIANRSYPLKVTLQQEEAMRNAAALVNERMKEYETAYAVRDHQDLLAMCALQLASEQIGVQMDSETRDAEIKSELDALTELVNGFHFDN